MSAMTDTISFKPTRLWDNIAEKYHRQPIGDEPAYEHKLKVTREYFEPDFEVLEIGCGTGGTALRHAPFVTHIRATDASQGMIEIARRQAAKEGVSNVTFERTSIDDIDLPLGPVDAVMAMSLIHLLDNWRGGIAKMYDMLRPGGVFVSSTVCAGDHMAYTKPLVAVMRAFGKAPNFTYLKADDLRKAVADAGFTIEVDWQSKKNGAVFLVGTKPA